MTVTASPDRTRTGARRTRRVLTLGALLVVALPLLGCGPELGPLAKLAAIDTPKLPETSDPSVVRVDSDYYVYGSNNDRRAPITVTRDLSRVYSLEAKNAITREGMPTKPAWAAQSMQMWAPTVGRFANNRWIMYFSADRTGAPDRNNPQCVGRAFGTGPAGPFTPEASPLYCGGVNGTRGALDPQLFTDPAGVTWLLVALGNTESPLHTIRLYTNGDMNGTPVPLLTRQHPWEYHFIEQPAMVYDWSRKNYLLTYSAGRWWESRYSIGIARCSTPTGPCTSDPSGPWVASSNGRTGPGALSFFTDTAGTTKGIFASFQAGWETQVGGRSASIMPLTLEPAVGLGTVTK